MKNVKQINRRVPQLSIQRYDDTDVVILISAKNHILFKLSVMP